MFLLIYNIEDLGDLLAQSLCVSSDLIIGDCDFDYFYDPLFESRVEKHKSVDFLLALLAVQPFATIFISHKAKFFSDG